MAVGITADVEVLRDRVADMFSMEKIHVDKFSTKNDHYSFLKIDNDCGCPMHFQYAYFDEDSCGFMDDAGHITLQPEPNEHIPSGSSAIYGVTGARRASGLMGFIVQTNPEEWIALQVYFLNPYNGSDQIRIGLYVNNGPNISFTQNDLKKTFKGYYDGAGSHDIITPEPVSVGWLSAGATLFVHKNNEYRIRVYRNS